MPIFLLKFGKKFDHRYIVDRFNCWGFTQFKPPPHQHVVVKELVLMEEIRRSPVDTVNIPLFTGF